MESQKETRRKEQETPDIGASIFGGALVCLAVYGGYKLFQKEMNQPPLLESGVDSEIFNRIVDQELKS
ncbi:MAG: hypothetical protein KAR42_02995 [candidate division Zixibacteria bacterium]|nr:hypothetical protein [candidate division Zixibacteria bacterium]